MSDFGEHIRELGRIPAHLVTALKDKLARALVIEPRLWEIHDATKPNKYSVFDGNTQHIVFAFPVTQEIKLPEPQFAPIWDDWKESIQSVIDEATAFYNYPNGKCGRIMLAKLLPGGVINRHRDHPLACEIPHKIHVPLITNQDVEFWEEDSIYHLQEGRSYEVNNRILHGGCNRSAVDRVHLIFDYFDCPAA